LIRGADLALSIDKGTPYLGKLDESNNGIFHDKKSSLVVIKISTK